MNHSKENIKITLMSDFNKGITLLFEQYYIQLVNYACCILESYELAEEVVQESFLTLIEKKELIDDKSSIISYLYRIVYNNCIDLIRHNKVEKKYVQFHLNVFKEAYEIKSTIPLRDLKKRINVALQKLPKKRRRIFILSRFKELKNKEIAEKLKISVKTVEAQIGNALKMLRNELKDINE